MTPFEQIKAQIHADPEYAFSWLCNLAVPIIDAAGVDPEKANAAGALIMAHMFNYDITTHPHFEGVKSREQVYFEMRVAAEHAEDTTND